MEKYICPICGYDGLEEKPDCSYEICPCCGYEFGSNEYFDKSNCPVDVGYEFDYKENEEFYAYVRSLWLKNGAKWWAKDERKPKNWDLIKQLNNIQNYVFEKNRKHGEFLEFQFCEKENSGKINLKSIKHWQESSLYVYSENPLFKKYLALLQNALLSNGEIGFDESGTNYYTHEKTIELYNKIQKDENLPDKKVLLEWLDDVIKTGHGFYILGI